VTSNLVSGFDLPLLFDCRVPPTIVYCEAVRSAILATAWLVVQSSVETLDLCSVLFAVQFIIIMGERARASQIEMSERQLALSLI